MCPTNMPTTKEGYRVVVRLDRELLSGSFCQGQILDLVNYRMQNAVKTNKCCRLLHPALAILVVRSGGVSIAQSRIGVDDF